MVTFHLPPELGVSVAAGPVRKTYEVSLMASLDDAKRLHATHVLRDCGGNISVAAKRLGLARSSLQRMLRRWRRP